MASVVVQRVRAAIARQPSRAFGLLLAALVALAYANSLRIGFHYDDASAIKDNPAVRSLRNVPSFFVDPFTLTTTRNNVDLRPVLLTSFALNYAVSGLDPWSWHGLNLLLHFVAALLVFVIVRDHLWPGGTEAPQAHAFPVAAAAALFFALAPLNSQPLDYMYARSALLTTTLYLGGFLCFLRGRVASMALLHALALLTKAIALTLPCTVLLYVVIYRVASPGRSGLVAGLRRHAVALGILAALDAGYLAYRAAVLPPWTFEVAKEPFVTPGIWLMSGWPAQLFYVRQFVFPDGLSLDHQFPTATHFWEARVWLALFAILAWLGAALAVVARHPIAAFASLWFFVTLSIESTFWPLTEVVNDHRPYIASSLGLAVLLAWLLERASARLGPHARAGFALAVALPCVAAIPMIWYRNWQWSDPVRIWEDAAQKGPSGGRAWMNAGLGLMSRGDLPGARQHFERARALSPGYSYVYMNLSVLALHEGRSADALREADEAVRLDPGLSLTHFYRGQALERLGETDEAGRAYGRALAADPRDARAADALRLLPVQAQMSAGLDALYARRDAALAVAHFRAVLSAVPTHYGATYQLATALDAAGRSDEALPLWTRMLAMGEAAHDAATVAACRARIERPPPRK